MEPTFIATTDDSFQWSSLALISNSDNGIDIIERRRRKTNDYIDLGSNFYQVGSGDVSISVWINPQSQSGNKDIMIS